MGIVDGLEMNRNMHGLCPAAMLKHGDQDGAGDGAGPGWVWQAPTVAVSLSMMVMSPNVVSSDEAEILRDVF
jgi:hypothetical protein